MRNPPVIWLTGLSGSGKTTIALALIKRLYGCAEYLDGDDIRSLFPSTSFEREAREEHVKRVGWTASLLQKHGVWVVVSLVSPYRASRDWVRGLCHPFYEVHVATSPEVCARRDTKGLYAKAYSGQLLNFPGVTSEYEEPESPEVVVDAGIVNPEYAAYMIVKRVTTIRKR